METRSYRIVRRQRVPNVRGCRRVIARCVGSMAEIVKSDAEAVEIAQGLPTGQRLAQSASRLRRFPDKDRAYP